MKFFAVHIFLLSLVIENAFSRSDYHQNFDDDGYALCKYGPCLNGGTCTVHPDKYYCSCLPGWVGNNCERRNNCFPNPCHYGTCSPNIDGYTCTCKVGFKGSLCNILDRCHPNPCHSNGVCTETNHGVQCGCAPGFKGKLCELESKCDPINPCLNGGVCREFTDHYHCSCPESFKGQNCEDFVSPTRAPPTVPFKQVGPQAIPAPVNAPTSDIHDVYTLHSYDEFGNPYSEMHEETRKGSEGLVNPGASLVPHPVRLHGMHSEPGSAFVGAPTFPTHDGIIIHQDGDDQKPALTVSGDGDKLPADAKDDRYQTHFVEVNKDEYGKKIHNHGNSPNIGKEMGAGEYAPTPSNPVPGNEEEADKVLSENKHHREEMKENAHQHHQDDHVTNEKHIPQHHDKYADQRSDLAPKPSRTRTGTARSIVLVTEKIDKQNTTAAATGDKQNGSLSGEVSEDESKQNMKAISDMLKMFDKATKTLSDKIVKNANRVMVKQGKTPYRPQATHVEDNSARTPQQQIGDLKQDTNLRAEDHQASSVPEVSQYLKNIDSLSKSLMSNIAKNVAIATKTGVKKTVLGQDSYRHFTNHQKDAYKSWRRQALLNYHARNPGKPIPRNTVSLSKNSLCPKFCRLFCDPWCVKIGCCKLSQEKLNIYKEIERKTNEAKSKLETRKGIQRKPHIIMGEDD